MAGIGIALKGAGKVLKKFSKKVARGADKEAGKMIKQMNSPKAIEKAKESINKTVDPLELEEKKLEIFQNFLSNL